MTRHGPPEAIATCACGGWYGDDDDGREAHKKVLGHYPIPPTEKAPETVGESTVQEDGDAR